VNRIIVRATAFALAAAASVYLLLLGAGVAVAASRSDFLPGRRLLPGKPLLSFGVELAIAGLGTALILGVAILFTPREPPAWQQAQRESRPGYDADPDDGHDEGHDEERDRGRDDEDWRTAA
jgi:hypothetical protein